MSDELKDAGRKGYCLLYVFGFIFLIVFLYLYIDGMNSNSLPTLVK
ncbi:MAG: hypothetical protein ABIV51_09605 [Saprospiraceae bacterium]